jgi:hypothetical protein
MPPKKMGNKAQKEARLANLRRAAAARAPRSAALAANAAIHDQFNSGSQNELAEGSNQVSSLPSLSLFPSFRNFTNLS